MMVFLDIYPPTPTPRGQGRGSKLLKSTFLVILPCIHEKDPQGKPNFMVLFLDMYNPPWGQGRGSKLLGATILAIWPWS